MKTFKRLTALVIAIIMCVAFCSCTFTQNVKIKKSGNLSVKTKYTLSKKEIKELETAMDDDTAFDEFIKESDKKGLTKTIDGVKYYSYVEDTDIDNLDDMNSNLSSAGKYTTTDFWAYANGAHQEDSSDYDFIIEKAGLEIHTKQIITFPYKIIETNCKKVNDYTISYSEGYEGMYVYAITKKSTAKWTKAKNKEIAIKAMAKKQYTPKKIKGVKVVYKNANALRVSWSLPNSLFVTGYKIERKVNDGEFKNFKTIKFLNVLTDENFTPGFVDKKVKPGETYSYRVKAYYKDSHFNIEGKYSKTKPITFTNLNKTPSFKLNVKGKNAIVKIKNFDNLAKGYQIKYSENKNFKHAKTVNTKTAKYVIKGLDTKKDYYVKVRKFVKGAGKNVYGKFSKVKKIIYV